MIRDQVLALALAEGQFLSLVTHSLAPWVPGAAPTFTYPPSDQTVTDGNTALFTCQTSGSPKPAITWRKGNRAA